jgi:hypothetical protein
MKTMEKATAWVIVGRNGKPWLSLLRPTRSRAIGAFQEHFSVSWAGYRKRGWRCTRVQVAGAAR